MKVTPRGWAQIAAGEGGTKAGELHAREIARHRCSESSD
jgi:hypothetical protein